MYTNLTDMQKKSINKACLKVLKLPGNAPKGDVLEMTLVVDCALEHEYICERAKEIITSLRSEGKSFLNLRLNLIKWKSDTDFVKYVSSYPDVLMGRTADEKDYTPGADKHLDTLTALLKKFYARSRIHLILLAGDYPCENPMAVFDNLSPFLAKKMVAVYPDAAILSPFAVREPSETSEETSEAPAKAPADSIAAPADSIAAPADSIAAPADSSDAPTDSSDASEPAAEASDSTAEASDASNEPAAEASDSTAEASDASAEPAETP